LREEEPDFICPWQKIDQETTKYIWDEEDAANVATTVGNPGTDLNSYPNGSDFYHAIHDP
jgi:hypothetical protein